MKKKHFKVIFYFLLFNFCFIGCMEQFIVPSKEYVTFNIKNVIIGGTDEYILEKDTYNSRINMFEFKIDYPLEYNFILSEGLKLNNNTLEFASRSQLNKDYTYKINSYAVEKDAVKEVEHEINGEKRKVYAFDLYRFSNTRLFIKDGSGFDNDIYKLGYNQPVEIIDDASGSLIIKTNTYNEIVLKYSLYGSANTNGKINFRIDGEQVFVDKIYPSMLFNYNAEWSNLSHNNSNIKDEKINILFMADGYSNAAGCPSLFTFYLDVRDNLMKEIKDSNLKTNWNDINIIALQTMSLDENRNICGINRPNPYGDIGQIKKVIQTSFFGSPIYLKDSGETNIDVIIIISTKKSSSEMTTDSSVQFNKKGKPVHIICYPQDRYWPIGKSLTECLRSALPGMYND